MPADALPEPGGGSLLRKLLPELRPFRGLVALSAITTLLQTGFGFVPPLLLGDILNRLQRGENVNTLAYLGAIVGFAIVQGLLGYAQAVSIAKLGQSFLVSLRDRMLGHLQSLPQAYFEKNQTGKIVSNVINDGATVNGLITSNLPTMLADAVQFLVVLVILARIDLLMTGLVLSVMPVYIVSFRRFWIPLQATSDDIRGKRDAMYGQMQERLTGVQTVKSYGRERWEARTFMSTTRELMGLNVKQGKLGGGLWTVADALCGLSTGLVLWVGGQKAIAGQMPGGTLIMFVVFAVNYVYGPVVRFLIVLDPLSRAQAALARIFRTLETPNSVVDKPGALPMPTIRGDVTFENVVFEYEPGQPVLKGIDLRIRAGEMVALVGFSGSGKTTLASLLLRNYDPTGGRLLIDGHDLRDVELLGYRRQIGVVAQESILFNTSLLENIRYGRPDATDAEVLEAAKAANVHDAIAGLPDGYNTRIGEEGVKLSVGEKQRVAIARALLADPRILILDEATSSLDSQTEALLQEALDRLMKGRTSFVIAHRLSTIVGADKIVVLEKGVVSQLGRHEELKDEGLYGRLYREQFRVALEHA